MREINMTIDVECPVEEVFGALADARAHNQWDPGMAEGRHEPAGPPQLGTKIIEVRRFMGRVIETQSEYVEFEANKKLVRKGDDGSMALTSILTFTETDSGTHVDWTWLLKAKGLMLLMVPIMAPILKRDGQSHLKNFKQLLENGGFKPVD